MGNFVLAIDQGTTSSRAMIFNRNLQPVASHQLELKQYFPQLGWVEHDAEEIWQATIACCHQAVSKAGITFTDIEAIGITNQRETTVVWDRKTGKPIYKAIVWQDRRTADYCQTLQAAGHEQQVKQKTGLLLDSYFSASKINWLLKHVDQARQRAELGELAFGTIDTFILWRLTGGKAHATDITNASRTLLFNIQSQRWDADLLKLFDIPESLLPEVFDNCYDFGMTESGLFGKAIPILGMAGDQQAAMIGQACFQSGMAKSTYGTGIFLMLNIGEHIVQSQHRLLTTIAYRLYGKTFYALEGSIFAAGSTIHWLRDKLQVIKQARDTEALATSVADNGGVYFVPAFTGLGAPYWDPYARAAIQGLTRDSQIAHIVRAALEAVAYQTYDLIAAMQADSTKPILELRVDGGMVANNWLMQFLADMLQIPVTRSTFNETTALGAAYLAALGAGWFASLGEITKLWQHERIFKPVMLRQQRDTLLESWQLAVKRILMS